MEMNRVNDGNYHNLLSEYHLRPYEEKKIAEKQFDEKLEEILIEMRSLPRIEG